MAFSWKEQLVKEERHLKRRLKILEKQGIAHGAITKIHIEWNKKAQGNG